MKRYETTSYTHECDETGREYCFEVGFFHYEDEGRIYVEDIELTFEIALGDEGERVIKLTAAEEQAITEYVRIHDIESIERRCVEQIDKAAAFS